MTSFWTLFKGFFREKSKSAYWLLLINVIAALATTVIMFISIRNDGQPTVNFGDYTAESSVITVGSMTFAGMMAAFAGFIDFAYLIMTTVKNEKINRSQTWQLIPISNGKMYVSNTLSSLASLVYLGIMQLVIELILGLLTYFSNSLLRKEISTALTHSKFNFSDIVFPILITITITILVSLFWYEIVSFLHFITRTVIDFLPSANKFVLLMIRLVVLVGVVYFLAFLVQMLGDVYNNFSYFATDNGTGSMYSDFLEPTTFLLILDLIIGSLNCVMINKFVEAKAN